VDKPDNLKIFANYIVYNEELLLPISLASIYDYVDKIIIVDNESTDHTVASLEPYMDKVKLISCPSKDFSVLRNMALINSRDADYIVKIDADEIMFDSFSASLQKLAQTMEESDANLCSCYFYHMLQDLEHMQNANGGKDNGYRRMIMFKNFPTKISWVSPVHEYLLGVNPKMLDTEFFYMHLGYIKPAQIIFERWKLYSELENQPQWYDNQDESCVFGPRPHYAYNGYLPEALQDFLDRGGKLEWQL
jgi:hypothetical protein